MKLKNFLMNKKILIILETNTKSNSILFSVTQLKYN